MQNKQLSGDDWLKEGYIAKWITNEYSSDKAKDGFPYVIWVKAKWLKGWNSIEVSKY